MYTVGICIFGVLQKCRILVIEHQAIIVCFLYIEYLRIDHTDFNKLDINRSISAPMCRLSYCNYAKLFIITHISSFPRSDVIGHH